MEQKGVRDNIFYCKKWSLFAISLAVLIASVIMAVMSNEIIKIYLEIRFGFHSNNFKLDVSII